MGESKFYDREATVVRSVPEPSDGVVGFLYGSPVGRCLLKLMAGKWPSKAWGAMMRSPLSRGRIRRFCSENGLDDERLVKEGFAPSSCYGSFAEFFVRSKEVACDGQSEVLYSPVDGYLSVHQIADDLSIDVKGTTYTLPELVGNGGAPWLEGMQGALRGGSCLVFRLSLTDYHHFHYPASGRRLALVEIPGELHSVRQVASGKRPFSRNRRDVSALELDEFGPAMMVEVGAMLVGLIEQDEVTPAETLMAGRHKGCFSLGGSTVIILIGDTLEIDGDIAKANGDGLETRVRAGTRVGMARCQKKGNTRSRSRESS